MNDLDARVLSAIRSVSGPNLDHPTAAEIAELVNAKVATVSTALQRLRLIGLVDKFGVAFNGSRTWALTESGREVVDRDAK